MTAERLRQAAGKLRGLAEGATPGPWEVRQLHDGQNWASEDEGRLVAPVGRDYPIQPGGGEAEDYGMETPDAHYIAAMHPPVALALADWIEAVAERAEQIKRHNTRWWVLMTRSFAPPMNLGPALAVADAILGEA